MENILLITSSPRGEHSHSSRIALDLAHRLSQNVTIRELWRTPLPLIGPENVQAMFTPADARTDEQRAILAESDRVVEELFAADHIVIAAGMINFSIPATLKTWIDHIIRVGLTFSYEDGHQTGLVSGKKVTLVLASGGDYTAPVLEPMEPVLRKQLGFIGITDIQTIWIQGTMHGPDVEQLAVERAMEQARQLVDGYREPAAIS